MRFGEMTVIKLRSVLSIPALLRVFIINVLIFFFLHLWSYSFSLGYCDDLH